MAGYGSGLYGRGNYGIDPKEIGVTVNATSSTSASAQIVKLAAVASSATSSTTVTANRVQSISVAANAAANGSVSATRIQQPSVTSSATSSTTVAATRIQQSGATSNAALPAFSRAALHQTPRLRLVVRCKACSL